MVAITGGAPSVRPAGGMGLAALDRPSPDSTEERIASALLACMARWGLAKTTVEDIAREAGVSRATVYRSFPGGKSAISEAAALQDVRRLVDVLRDGLEHVAGRPERLAAALHLAASFFAQHDALNFVRAHEPEEFERLVRLERLDVLLLTAGELLGPVLRPVLDDDRQATDVAIWLARLVASHVVTPSPTLDLTDPRQARAVVDTHVMPGLSVAADPHVLDPTAT